jgi:penicillin-binding protein 2
MDFFPDKEPRELKARILLPTVVIIFAFFILIARLWYLQVMAGSHYEGLARNNSIRLVKSTAQRGLIFDRYGTRLAENRPGFDLIITPSDVKDREMTITALTKLVDIDSKEIEERLEKARKLPPFVGVKIKRDISWEEMVRVELKKFKLPGVALRVGPKRSYTSKGATAHLVGYLGEVDEKELRSLNVETGNPYKSGDMTGKYGIEHSYEDYVRGIDGGSHIEVDVLGREIRVLKLYPPEPGKNLHTTIDLPAQMAAWDAMKERAGAVCAMNPNTGEILVLLSTPSFDPNALTIGVTKDDWRKILRNPLNVLTNRAIQGQYPPASTFKVITAAAALEENIVKADEEIFSGPSFFFRNREYRDWKEAGHGEINIHRAIVESSDTFFYQVGLSLGIKHISDYAKWFGLGVKTGIRLKDEKSGLVPTSDWKRKNYGVPWYKGETLSVSVGQGFMLSTPLQMARAFSAIANGGTLYKPMLVNKITNHEGEVVEEFAPEKKGTLPVSKKTLSLIRGALKGVVWEDGGTARSLMLRDLVIAGKTGTAQVITLTERVEDIEETPYKFRDHGWFVGFAPYDKPEIVVAVLVEHGGFGSRSAAPVARQVIQAFFKNKKIREQIKEMKKEKTKLSVTGDAPESSGENG